jgi:hypothetical protein
MRKGESSDFRFLNISEGRKYSLGIYKLGLHAPRNLGIQKGIENKSIVAGFPIKSHLKLLHIIYITKCRFETQDKGNSASTLFHDFLNCVVHLQLIQTGEISLAY